MTHSQLSEALNVQIPEEVWNTYYPQLEARKNELCSLTLLEKLEEKFSLFGEYFEAVKEGFLDLENDPARKLYLDLYSLYMRDCSGDEAKRFDYPKPAGTPASNMLALLVHLPALELAEQELAKRGFSHEEIKHNFSIYRIYLWEVEKYRDGFIGIPPYISNWMSQFTKCEIYYPGHGGLNFQLLTIADHEPYFLQNRKTGELLPVFGNSIPFHVSGVVLGSAGAEDPEGSFVTEFKETENAYIGHPVRNIQIYREAEEFSKEEWELVLKPGDWVISTHIFFGADFTKEVVDLAFAEGQRMAREYFPEYNIKAQRCSSWLMNPLINEALGENAKLSGFSSRFVRYPRQSVGEAFIRYVFPGMPAVYEDLPEDSRLQKAFKKHLLDGGKIYEYSGMLMF